MDQKKPPLCSVCGKPVSAGMPAVDGKIYCPACQASEDRTVMVGADTSADKTMAAGSQDADKTMAVGAQDADKTMAVGDDGRTVALGGQDEGRTVAIEADQAGRTMPVGPADEGRTMAIGATEGDKTLATGADDGRTVAIGDKTMPVDQATVPGRTQATSMGTATGSRAQSSAQASRAQRTGTWASTMFTMNKSMAATKVIRDVLKITPDVDLEHASKMYYTRHGKAMSKEDAATIQDLISRSNAESKYIYDKELGRGGMGAVFSTVDQDVRRKVAMKVMLPNTASSPAHIKRFLEEAQITGQLEHPNIVPVHEVGINEESSIYFTMKMVRGENLDSVIDKIEQGKEDYRQKYSLGVMLQIFMKVCDAIGYAHAKGVLHRDLKPENLMIGDFGEVLVMDWGLAKVLGREDIQAGGKQGAEAASAYHTMEGQVMGTPAYMSPEQALGQISELDERSDIFSLGGILYKILTGHAPYRGKNAREALDKARKRQLQPPDLRVPERKIPPELTAICMKAMGREKGERYGTVEELKEDIQRYLDGKSVSAKRDNVFVMAKKWVMRNKVAAMGIAGAVVCLILGVAGAVGYQQKQKYDTIHEMLSQGSRLTAAAPELDKKIADMTEKVEKTKASLKGYEGYDKKKPVWDQERSLLDTQIDRLKTEGKAISKYTEVLSLDVQNKQARSALAKIYYEKYRDAEALRQSGDMAYYKELIFAFDDGTYKALLDKEGALTLATNPAADGFYIFRFVEGPDRRLVPAPFSSSAYFAAKTAGDDPLRGIDPQFKLDATGAVPISKLITGRDFNFVKQIEKLRLPEGSYMVLVKKPGYIETRIPVVIDRGEDKKLDVIRLLTEEDVPRGFVYIPKGEFIYGGDPEAANAAKREVRKVPGFLISVREVTVGEYLKFMNYQESVRPGSAENYLPRKSTDSGFYWQKVGSQYQPSFPLDWPVLGVARVDGSLYCKWFTKANNDKWEFRLPEDWEWEKAARGVDGRSFPWGNYFDFSFCSMGKSREGRREGPDKVGSFPLDESVYGVQDMGGNVSEWTASFLDQEKLLSFFKGGGWSKIEDKFPRCASRNAEISEAVADDRGFRIAISIKE